MTAYTWAGGRLADAWPAAPGERDYSRVRTSDVETLLIGGALDFSTPPQVATKELLPHLPNGHEVVLPGFGHTASFFAVQPEAGTRLVNTFLDSGRVDESLYRPQRVDFTPGLTLSTAAKLMVGAMIGLALLAVLSLLLMARRVHTRGRFGRRASATLRALCPLLLGLGGWFLGALIVLTAMPGVPLDNTLLAVLAVGVPVGLGVSLAWVHRDWSAATRRTGFAAAMTASLAGAWAGFVASAGPPALIAAIVGAAAGVNLALVLLDIAWDRQARDRFAAPEAKETLEGHAAQPV